MKTINYNQIIKFHTLLINKTGGIDGIKDMGLVKSALERHKATFDSVDLYPSMIEKISVTTTSLVKNHGFLDGNKRIGISVMLLLLKFNNIEIKYTQAELIDLGIGLAALTLNEKAVMDWIESHTI